MVIADNCAIYVNQCFEDIHGQTGITLLLSAIFYSFQMYADFSGYSDMAIGVAKLLGFRVTRNFDFPFFAQNIAEFWRKWHISLTSWLTDYLFMPLNIKFRNIGKCGIIFAIIINFVICGLWHGDNWTFVLWGLYHGLLFIPLILSGTMFKKKKIETFKWGFPKPKILLKILLTFALVTGGLILFRADNIGQAFDYFINMIDKSLFPLIIMRKNLVYQNLFFIFLMLIIEWLQRNNQHGLELNRIKSHIIKFAIYYFLITTIFIFAGQSKIFIYFQF
jgi:D-alanyl-lipoteichoic acid acyltransferase DltB (MBOAT superfamily)